MHYARGMTVAPPLERLRSCRVAQLGLSVLLSISGCAGGSVEVPGSALPKPDALDAITSIAPGPSTSAAAGRRVPSWTLEAPLATQVGVGPARGDNVGEQLLAQLSGAKIVYDEALACFAHQLLNFFVHEREPPIQPLLSFMRHRCGVTATQVNWVAQPSMQPPGLADANALATKLGGEGPMGMWSVQVGEQHVLLAATGRGSVQIQPLSMAAPGREVVIEGRSSAREWMLAYVNHGESGVETCENHAGTDEVFRLVCPLDMRDQGTYVDVLVAPPGHLFGEHAARLWLSPNGSMPTDYLSPVSPAGEAPLPTQLEPVFVEMVNQLRTNKGLSAIREVPAQSAVIEALLPYYTAARTVRDHGQLDEIALGLMAGWEVPEPVLMGGFASLALESVSTRAELLELVLYQPYLRASVLEPGVERVGVSFAAPEGEQQLRTGLFTTYHLASEQPELEAQALVQRINYVRRTRRNPEAEVLPGSEDALARAAGKIRMGKAGPQQAMGEALQSIANANPQTRVQGFATFVQGVSKFETPKELLTNSGLKLAVHVEFVETSDSPWVSLLVLIAFATHN